MHAAAYGDVLKNVRSILVLFLVLSTSISNQWLIILYMRIFSAIMERISALGNILMSHTLLTDFRSSEPQKFISSKRALKHGN